MNGYRFEALIPGILQLNQTFLTTGLDSEFYLFFVIVIKFFYLFFCSVVDMFRDAPAGTYLVIVEDIPVDPPAEQPRRQALQQMEQPEQEQEALEGGQGNPCVVF